MNKLNELIIAVLIIFTALILLIYGCVSQPPITNRNNDYIINQNIISGQGKPLFDFCLSPLSVADSTVVTTGDRDLTVNTVISTVVRDSLNMSADGYIFRLSQSGRVKIRFYNFSEQYLATLFEGFLGKGIYELNFERIKAPEGTYILKVVCE